MKESRHRKKELAGTGRPGDVRRGWCYPRQIRSFAERLLGQQLWCWGRDIVHSDGNLLLEYGFRRYRDRKLGRKGATCYRLDSEESHIALWGFGIFYGQRKLGGLYVNRFAFQPRWAHVESLSLGIHASDDLAEFRRPRTNQQWDNAHRLLRHMLDGITRYETWIRKVAGPAYREQCVAAWLYPFVPADKMPAAWKLLRERCWDLSEEPLFKMAFQAQGAGSTREAS